MSTRKADRKSKKGTRKQCGGKRRLSDWNKEVKLVYNQMKKQNPNTLFKDALVEASRRKKEKKQ